MEISINFNQIFEKKLIFYALYKIYYIQNKNSMYNDISITLRDSLINKRYKTIHEIIYENGRPIIKKLLNCSFKEKIVHHFIYFYSSKIDLNKKEIISIIKGDLAFIHKSFNLLKKDRPISVIEYKIVYELIEYISNLIKEEVEI